MDASIAIFVPVNFDLPRLIPFAYTFIELIELNSLIRRFCAIPSVFLVKISRYLPT